MEEVKMTLSKSAITALAFLVSVLFLTSTLPSALWAAEGCDQAAHLNTQARFSKDTQKAIQLYAQAIEMCPGFIRPYEMLGNLYRNQGQKDKAIALFTTAAELGTNNYKLYHLLASLLFEKNEMDDAHRHIQKALSIRADFQEALELQKQIEAVIDREGPRLTLYEPATARGLVVAVPQDNLTVRGLATDKSGVAWVKVNEFTASLDETGNFLKDIPVSVGANTIVVEAADRLGNRTTLSITVERKASRVPASGAAGLSDFYGKSIAVVIGINRYEKWPPLEYAVEDAKAIRKRLQEIGFGDVTLILDKEATQGRILTELFRNLPQKVGPDDRLIFYFAGHGQTEDVSGGGKKGYIIPVDGEPGQESGTAISMEQVRSLSSRIPAKHILYVMDSCYSGLGLSRSAGLAPTLSGFLRKVASMRAVQIVTAGGSGEQAQERGGHGLFTGFFLKALEGEADINKDGVVTGSELGTYLRPTVSEASSQAQTPLYGRLEGEGEFLFFIGKR
jgi:tetratricopeptide (TPR) repeat protein